MLAEERFKRILDIVETQRSVTVQELVECLGISESTIRRDLTALATQGLLNKVHGGATINQMDFLSRDAAIAERRVLNLEAKDAIGREAAAMIKPDDFVFIDAGTSTEALIEHIVEKNAVFVTNSASHARRLAEKGCRIYIIGGELKSATQAIVGEEAIQSLQKYHFTLGFFGTNGVRVKEGLTTPDVNEALVKKEAMKHCRKKIVLCDSSKFQCIAPVAFSKFNEAVILTEKIPDKEWKKYNNVVEVNQQ